MENLKKSLTWILVIIFLSYFGMENCCKIDTKTPLFSISGEDSLDIFGDPVYIETSDWNFNKNVSFSSIDRIVYENEWGGDSLDVFGNPVYYIYIKTSDWNFNKTFQFANYYPIMGYWTGEDSVDIYGNIVYRKYYNNMFSVNNKYFAHDNVFLHDIYGDDTLNIHGEPIIYKRKNNGFYWSEEVDTVDTSEDPMEEAFIWHSSKSRAVLLMSSLNGLFMKDLQEINPRIKEAFINDSILYRVSGYDWKIGSHSVWSEAPAGGPNVSSNSELVETIGRMKIGQSLMFKNIRYRQYGCLKCPTFLDTQSRFIITIL